MDPCDERGLVRHCGGFWYPGSIRVSARIYLEMDSWMSCWILVLKMHCKRECCGWELLSLLHVFTSGFGSILVWYPTSTICLEMDSWMFCGKFWKHGAFLFEDTRRCFRGISHFESGLMLCFGIPLGFRFLVFLVDLSRDGPCLSFCCFEIPGKNSCISSCAEPFVYPWFFFS